MKLLIIVLLSMTCSAAFSQTNQPVDFQDSVNKYGKAADYLIQRYEKCSTYGEKRNLYYLTEYYKAKHDYYYLLEQEVIRFRKQRPSPSN